MFAKWWFWAALVLLIALGAVFGIPLTHSPRHDALEPHLRPFAPFEEIRQVAAEHNIPLEFREEDERRVTYAVPLNGSKRGQTLFLHFRNGELFDARSVDGAGQTVRQYFCILR